MKCINEAHDHDDTLKGQTLPAVCGDCAERIHYDSDADCYVHDNVEQTCWLIMRGLNEIPKATPCRFNVREVLESVLPEIDGNLLHVNWSYSTTQETSDLLNNLRDAFSEFWGVRV